jgi:TRAP-type C4-dicarboxylate transport system permease small subunit
LPSADRIDPADAEAARRPTLRLERVVMAASMAALCIITMANVLVRYFTDISFAFTEEISIALMVVMTLTGAAHAFVDRKHIAITFFVGLLGARGRRIAAGMSLLSALILFATLALLGSRMAWDDYRFEVTSPALGIPQWIYTVWLPLLSALIVFRVLGALRRWRMGGD